MNDEIQKYMWEALVKVAFLDKDIYGVNKLQESVNTWLSNNKSKINEWLTPILNSEEFATQVAKKYKENMSQYERDRFTTKVDELMKQKLAEMLAKDEYEKLKSSLSQ